MSSVLAAPAKPITVYGSCLIEMDKNGKIVWKSLGGKIGKPTNVQVISESGDPSKFELCK